jgi:hypothetical protein
MAEYKDKTPPEPLAWDRVGQFFQDMAAVGQGIAQRNQDLWAQVSEHLRANRYPADAMTTDAAKAMTTAMDNLEDVWTFLTRPPERERVATTLPTVFLRFLYVHGKWSVQDPVWIRVGYWDRQSLPAKADIYIDGDPKRTQPLKEALRTELVDKAYVLTTAEVQDLEEGVYTGIITAGDRPLASLRVVVERSET